MTDQIRFLPLEPAHQPILWVKREDSLYGRTEDAANLMLDLARTHDRPVFRQIKKRAYTRALPVIGTIYDQPAPSRHRSKRLWKKLRRKTARSLYGEPMTLSFDPHLFRLIDQT